MSKIELKNIASGFNLSRINDNFEKIETALNSKVLYRDNPKGEPNQMKQSLDMDGKDIINVRRLNITESIAIDGIDLATEVAKAEQSAALAAALLTTAEDTLETANEALGIAESIIDGVGEDQGSDLIGFKVEDGVRRTVSGKLKDVISVKDFGAIGDGVTDETAAFFKAASVGWPYYVPRGQYKITDSSVIEKAFGDGFIDYNGNVFPAGDILSFTILRVPSAFPSIQTALDYLQKRRIRASEVHIQVADGTYTHTETVYFNHPDSSRIRLFGNLTDPSRVVINIGTKDGFNVQNANLHIRGFTIMGSAWTSHGSWSNISTALNAVGSGAFIYCVDVVVKKVYYGFAAGAGGHLDATNCHAEEAGDGGFFSFGGGVLYATNCTAKYSSDRTLLTGLGFGFVAEMGTMWMKGCTSTENDRANAFANVGANVIIDNCNLNGNPAAGAWYGGEAGQGLRLDTGSKALVMNTSISNNTTQNCSVINGSHLTTFNCLIFSAGQQGISLSCGAVANLNLTQVRNNATIGVEASLGSFIRCNSSVDSSGNGVSNYSPTFDLAGNQGSWIAN